jgi:hypothetical protein
MTFQVKIECDNAAFTDNACEEIARILREIATKLDGGRDGGFCMDYNGNRVGEFALSD